MLAEGLLGEPHLLSQAAEVVAHDGLELSFHVDTFDDGAGQIDRLMSGINAVTRAFDVRFAVGGDVPAAERPPDERAATCVCRVNSGQG